MPLDDSVARLAMMADASDGVRVVVVGGRVEVMAPEPAYGFVGAGVDVRAGDEVFDG